MTNPLESALIPNLVLDDANAAIDFYIRAFGAELFFRQDTPDGGKVIHASLVINGGLVMLSDDFPEMNDGVESSAKALGGSPCTLHMTIEDVEPAWQQAVDAGATVEMPLSEQFWGSLHGVLIDPFGHRWSLGTPQRNVTEEEMREGAEAAFAPTS